MTPVTFIAMWTVASIVSSLVMGRWLGGHDLIDEFARPMRFRLDDD